ncbi:DUF983 domain-containing protein [Polymorphobacter sp.]|uniref:DUF983 domain-containing protein n=1 Tax=Polymorphobacter sp. TaxID=1909290 RepID=UPI003F71D9BC
MHTQAPLIDTARPLGRSLMRGLAGHCPNCGEGKLFGRFLKPVASCAHCGQDISGHAADDFPAYIVIFLIGHILAPIAIAVEARFAPPLWGYAVFGSLTIIVMALAMLQPVKGGVIGWQWALRMHGFAKG